MAESMITNTVMDDDFEQENIKLLVEKKDWMKECTFKLVQDIDSLRAFVDEAIAKGFCAVDTETTGLSTRVNRDGKPVNKIVGFCLAYSRDYGIYIPVHHTEKNAINIPEAACIEQIKRLVANCVTIYANFKFDGEFLRNHGVVIEDWKKVIDVQLMHYVLFAHHKARGLKLLARTHLNRDAIEISELFPGSKGHVAFHTLSPRMALEYAASDAVNTFGVWEEMSKLLDEADPVGKNGIRGVLDIERRCQIVVMEMERNLIKINRPYYEDLRERMIKEIAAAKELVYKEAGQIFDIASPKQLGEILFEKMKLKYPIEEMSESGGWKTGEEVLDKIKDAPIAKAILKHRELEKILGTYIENFLKNADWNDEVKFSMKQASADTGRFSATGGDGLEIDGYSGVNCQNIPAAPKDPKAINIRKGMMAHDGWQMLSIDFSGEELRIATNLSHEPVWIKEFVHGKGDLHSVSAANIYKKTVEEMSLPENKTKRGVGKSVNFLTLYGGGPGRLAEVAKVSMDQAKVLLENFFEGVPVLQKWLMSEGRSAMRRGYSMTSFGRRRDLSDFFKDPSDKKSVSAGMRRATNGAIQGCMQASERVLTNQGLVPISVLKERKERGDDIRVWTGKAWSDFSVYAMGEWDLANVTLENGFVLHCDTRHRVLVEGKEGYEFRMYDELQVGDRVCVNDPQELEFGSYPDFATISGGSANNSRDLTISAKEDWDFLAYLSGVIIGDGNLRINDEGRYSATLCFGDEKVAKLLPSIRDNLSRMGVEVKDPRISSSSLGVSYRVSINSRALVETLVGMGMQALDSHTKRVPQFMFEAPLAMRKAFLKGYWDTDGCKKRANRYSFHTPNELLLRDMQLLAQTLGLGTRICATNACTFRLDFMDLDKFERFYAIAEGNTSSYRNMGKTRAPKWAADEMAKKLHPIVKSAVSPQDYALVNKMQNGLPVLVETLRMLASKYDVELPELYLSFPVVRKEELGRSEVTFSLAVQDESHRYTAGGVINKNTGADIIKIALYRVWRYIRNGGYENEVRILMPIHDEIVFEVRTDCIHKHIPNLVEVMKMDDILKDQLKWEVGLECDAEFGDDFCVKHNYFEELRAAQEKSAKEPSTLTPELPEEDEGESSAPVLEYTEALEKSKPSEDGVTLFANDDQSPYFDYEVMKTDNIAKAQTESIWEVLKIMEQNGYSRGPKKRIRLIRNGIVVHKTFSEFSLDGFVSLALYFQV